MPTATTAIIELARLAPSVHNIQPWRFTVDESTITLFVEPSRVLKEGDPTTRELWVSMGIIFETLLLAAKGLGFHAKVTTVQTQDTTLPIARLSLAAGLPVDQALIDAIKKRHSYRGHLDKTPLPASLESSLREAIADLTDTSLFLRTDQEMIGLVGDITEKGMNMALSSKPFREELAPLLHTNWSNARTGLHGFVMEHGLLGSVWQKLSVVFNIDTARQAKADKARVHESSGLLFITAKGDVPPFWFDAGRAYMRLVLEITKAGYAHSTLTAAVEAGRFHEDIERLLGTDDRILSLIRIGKPQETPKKTSPRLPVDSLTTSP